MAKTKSRQTPKNSAPANSRFAMPEKIKTLTAAIIGKLHINPEKLKKYRKIAIRIIKKIRSKVRPWLQKSKKLLINLLEHWKIVTVFLPMFLVMYYVFGSWLAENIDVKAEYKVSSQHLPMFETTESMSFLLKRELDDKMWTPNIPIIFPAYVLDNMPNFQIGIVRAVRDISAVIKNFEQNSETQQKNIKSAYKYLSYSPRVWIMSRKGKFNLAPSSNTQYRKAAAELHKFSKNGVFHPQKKDLDTLLQKMNKALQSITSHNEVQQREKASEWIDTTSDDLFYYAKGYAFALWQISKTLGSDYKQTVLECNMYTEWTYLVNSLKKAAEFKPLVVLNGAPDSLWTPNHLIMQNYYLQRAMIAAERIRNGLKADAD